MMRALVVLSLLICACGEPPAPIPAQMRLERWAHAEGRTFSVAVCLTDVLSVRAPSAGLLRLELVQKPADTLPTRLDDVTSLGCAGEAPVTAEQDCRPVSVALSGECASPTEGNRVYVRVTFTPEGREPIESQLMGAPPELGGDGRSARDALAEHSAARRGVRDAEDAQRHVTLLRQEADRIRRVAAAHREATGSLPTCAPLLPMILQRRGRPRRFHADALRAAVDGAEAPASSIALGLDDRLDVFALLREVEGGTPPTREAVDAVLNGGRRPRWVQVVDVDALVLPDLVGDRYTPGLFRGSVTVISLSEGGASCREAVSHVMEDRPVQLAHTVDYDPEEARGAARSQFAGELVRRFEQIGPPDGGDY